MKDLYDLLIVGATVYGAAAAEKFKDLKLAVIESGCTCAREFSSALKGEKTDVFQNKLYDELEKRGAVSEGKLWLPAVAPVTARLYADTGADCYFFSFISDIVSKPGFYTVTFVCYGVEYTLKTRNIIDTTSLFDTHGWFGEKAPSVLKQTLNYTDRFGRIKESPADHGMTCARISLESDDKIAMMAFDADVTPEKSYSMVWQPSAGYDSAAAAYEAGLRAILPEKTQTVEVPVVSEGKYDIIVVGIGTAGSSAAIKAARNGLKVLAVDSMPVPGGTATAGGIYTYYYGFKGGLYTEIDDAAKKNELFTKEPGIGGQPKIIELDKELRKSGVDARYKASFIKTLKDVSKATGIMWIENGAVHSARSAYIIDCTAEAAVCVNAGCDMLGGRQSDGAYQPFSAVYFRKNEDGSTGTGYCDEGVADPYDADDFGKKVLSALTGYLQLRENYAGHEFLGTAPLIGLREGRKIVGEETVRLEELVNGIYTDKPLYYGRSNLDNHGKDDALEDRIYRDWTTICGMWGWCLPIPVPAGALIPKGWDGILAAGRDVSVEHNLAMGLRMKDDAYKSGEAAAELASMAVLGGISARDVDTGELRERLKTDSCLNTGENVMDLEQQTNVSWHHEPWWCDDDDEITKQLSGDAPGYAIWSARANGKTDLLLKLISGDDSDLRWNAALSLALIGDSAAVVPLIEAACSRDGFIPKSGRKYNNLRSVSAISALGRLGDERAVQPLLALLDDLGFTEKITPTDSSIISDSEDIRFQYETHIIVSLTEIAEKHQSVRKLIRDRITEYIKDRSFRVTMMGTRTDIKKDCTESIRAIAARI